MVKPYLKSTNDAIRLTSLAIVAVIVNEDECDILVTHDKLTKFLLSLLEEGMESERRLCKVGSNVWSTVEVALSKNSQL